MVALLVERALESVVHRAVQTGARLRDNDCFADELFALLVGYVTGQFQASVKA